MPAPASLTAPSIEVAVCTNRPDAGILRVLDALSAQTQTPLVATAGLTADESRSLAARIAEVAPGARVISDPGPGLAHARNRALAHTDADVLCLLEDDGVPAAGWLPELRATWEQADESLAAVGGPVVADAMATPPWLSADQLATLGMVDHGPSARELDASRQTLMGANLSLRVSAARGVGGFWPARGHRDGRDWFSEEHHLQRDLGALGWRSAWAPGAVVSRHLQPSALVLRRLLSRRMRYGARMATLTDGSPPSSTLTQALRSLAGAPLASLQHRNDVAASRLGRGAQNAGALIGSRLVAGHFAATGPTPFRASVPTPKRRRRRRHLGGDGALVLLYHRVAETDLDRRGLSVSPANFAAQAQVLSARPVLALAELADLLCRGRGAPAGALVITFDDGYADNLAHAAPILARAGLPATVFAATAHVASGTPFFWDELDRLLLGPGQRPEYLQLEIDGQTRTWLTASPDARRRVRRHIHDWLQPRGAEEIATALQALRTWADTTPADPSQARPLTLDELRALATSPGLSVGAHTRSHVNLGHRPIDEQACEIAGSRDDLLSWLGDQPQGFSYPFGVPGEDFDAVTMTVVRAHGFTHAVANAPGLVTRDSNPFALPREVVPDVGAEAFEAWLAERSAPQRSRFRRSGPPRRHVVVAR